MTSLDAEGAARRARLAGLAARERDLLAAALARARAEEGRLRSSLAAMEAESRRWDALRGARLLAPVDPARLALFDSFRGSIGPRLAELRGALDLACRESASRRSAFLEGDRRAKALELLSDQAARERRQALGRAEQERVDEVARRGR